ncbi:MAG: S9 family peptidase [Anaerolineaceae bacterium]
MPQTKQELPFGLWPSPITPAMIGQGIRLNDVQWVPNSDMLVWCQSLSGKSSLFCKPRDEAPWDLTGERSPSGGVGYGGGEFTAGRDGVVFADKNGRLYHCPYQAGSPRALTPAFGRCAAPAISPDGKQVLYVHTYEDTDVLALANLDGNSWPVILAQGADFYMQPVWSPNDKAIAWVEWDHPNMPWDGTRLMFALLDDANSRLAETHSLDGDAGTPIFQPSFSPDGRLLAYVSNRGEWDQLMVLDLETGERQALIQEKSLLPPAWGQGLRCLAWTPEGNGLYYIENNQAQTSLHRVDLYTGSTEKIPTDPFTIIEQISVSYSGELAFMAESPVLPARILTLKDEGIHTVARSLSDSIAAEDLPKPQPIQWTSSDGAQVYGTYYPPANRKFTAVGAPPVIVYIHGGPTSQSMVGFSLDTAFFTSRGYGYFVVNYRGSSGYGRSYRDAMRGHWGEIDLIDTVEGAQALVNQGLADPTKLVIKGGSAGGYTVLNALVHYPGFFKAGLCSYGVSDLFSLDMDTHKFEAHYNVSLIGELPGAAQKYHDFSPIFHADKIRDAIAIFQGTDDKVVPQGQSESIVAVLKANKVPHEYHLYQGEGHGFRKSESLIDFYQSVDRFLKQYVIFSL